MKVFKKKNNWKSFISEIVFLGLVLFFVFIIILVYSQVNYPFTRGRMNKYQYSQKGDFPLVNGFADRDFSFIDEETTSKIIAEAKESVPVVYYFDQKISKQMVDRFFLFRQIVEQGIIKKLDYNQIAITISKSLDLIVDEGFISSVKEEESRNLLFDQCSASIKNLASKSLFSYRDNTSASFNSSQLLRIVKSKRHDILFEDIKFASIPTVRSEVRKEIDTLKQFLSPQLQRQAVHLLELFTVPNTFYDSALTKKMKSDIAARIPPVIVTISKGEQLFLEGEPLTLLQVKKIRALASFKARYPLNRVLFLFIYVLLLIFFAFLLFRPPFLKRKIKKNEFNILITLFLVGFLYSLLAINIVPANLDHLAYYFSIPLIVFVSSIMITSHVGFLLGLIFVFFQPALLMFTSNQIGDPLGLIVTSALFGILLALVSAWIVRNLKTLFDFVKFGFFLTLFIIGISFLYLFILFPIQSEDYKIVLFSAINGILITLLAPGLVLFFEGIFKILTTHRLVELADTSQPIFQQLITRAPGTYAHSMVVGNLAEAACQAIGANGLLARVGAYYHDIGKLDQPEYFIENQKTGNKHDEMKTALSVTVIKSHVKKGVERAIKLKLPQEIIDIIEQHHGNSLIQFFYNKALLGDDRNFVIKADYHYDSPIPSFTESAVVMLADSVEAASKSLKDATPITLDNFIWKLMMDKLVTGQLDHSDLTFKDLKKIRSVFVDLLSGNYHSRIKYPSKNNKLNIKSERVEYNTDKKKVLPLSKAGSRTKNNASGKTTSKTKITSNANKSEIISKSKSSTVSKNTVKSKNSALEKKIIQQRSPLKKKNNSLEKQHTKKKKIESKDE